MPRHARQDRTRPGQVRSGQVRACCVLESCVWWYAVSIIVCVCANACVWIMCPWLHHVDVSSVPWLQAYAYTLLLYWMWLSRRRRVVVGIGWECRGSKQNSRDDDDMSHMCTLQSLARYASLWQACVCTTRVCECKDSVHAELHVVGNLLKAVERLEAVC